MGRVLVDITPLREVPAYRRYFSAQLISVVGSMLTVVTLRYQAYKFGGDSTLAVSLLAVFTLVPMVLGSIIGGSMADAIEKKEILRVTQLVLMFASMGLALNSAQQKPSLTVLFAFAALASAAVGIDWPTRTSFVPGVVGKAHLPAAIALQIGLFNVAGIAGPMLAGFLVKDFGTWLYVADGFSYLAVFAVLFTLNSQPPSNPLAKVGLGSVAEGFRYLKTQRTIQSTFVADLGAMIFGLPDALFPAMAEKTFGNVHVLGYLTAAPAIGAVFGGLLNGWTSRINRQGMAVIWCIVVWGLGIALFGSTKLLWVALLGLAIAGAADAISATFRSTIVQVTVPEQYRGRLSSLFVAVVRGGPRLGELESGMAARFGGLQFAAVSGGLACIVWIAGVAIAFPELRAYTKPELSESDRNS